MIRFAKCRSCDAPIVWMTTEQGRNIPVDPDDVDESTLEWVLTERGSSPLFDPDEHVSHFATCPNADQHRRNRRQ